MMMMRTEPLPPSTTTTCRKQKFYKNKYPKKNLSKRESAGEFPVDMHIRFRLVFICLLAQYKRVSIDKRTDCAQEPPTCLVSGLVNWKSLTALMHYEKRMREGKLATRGNTWLIQQRNFTQGNLDKRMRY